jgi:hypothetical protein
MRKDVFICHAFEDKKDIVTPLANELALYRLDIWYDDFELKVGDDLDKIINKGLEVSRYGIVIISPRFLEKISPQNSASKILKKELEALFTKEVNGKKVVLPIWHNVERTDVEKYSSILASRYALRSSEGVPIIAKKLIHVIDDGIYLTKGDMKSIGQKFKKENPFKMIVGRPEERDDFWEITVQSNIENNCLQHPTLKVVFYTYDSVSPAKKRYPEAKREDACKVEGWGQKLIITDAGDESYGYIVRRPFEGWINGVVVFRRYNILIRIEYIRPLTDETSIMDIAERYAQQIDSMILNSMVIKGIVIS